MSLLKYFSCKTKNNPSLPLNVSVVAASHLASISLLSSSELEATNACIGKVLNSKYNCTCDKSQKENRYTPEEKTAIESMQLKTVQPVWQNVFQGS